MRSLREDDGQAIALFAVSLPLFLVLLLLVIDGGRSLVEHERLRNAAHFTAEAVASLAGDRGRAIPSEDVAVNTAFYALGRNLPEYDLRHVKGVTATNVQGRIVRTYDFGGIKVGVDAPPPLPGQPYIARIHLEKVFTATIQRITFNIAADAAAQLGQSAASSAAQRGDRGPVAIAPPQPPPAAGQAAVPAPTEEETCGKPSVAAGSITVPGEIGTLARRGLYSAIGSTNQPGARCGGDLYLGDGGATATYAFDVAAAGERDLWIRANDDGLHPAGARSVSITVNGQGAQWANEGQNVGWKWYRIGRFRLGEGRTEVRITKVAQTSAAFVMDEFALTSDPGFIPR